MLHHMLRAAAGNRGGIPTDGLIAHWTMDNISGSTLVDEMGSYNGTIVGATQIAGKFGQALDFTPNNGVNFSAPIIPSTGPWAMSLWINLDNFSATQGFWGQFYNVLSRRTVFYVGTGRKVGVQIGGSAVDGAINLNSGVYEHVILQRESGIIQVYVNNVLDINTTFAGTIDSQNSTLGYYLQGGAGGYTDGKIDQMRIYNRMLTVDEISQLYNEVA